MSFQSTHHSFSVELALKYGIEQAIIIHHFQHWIKFNRRKKSVKHFINERWWTYQKRSDIQAILPYLTPDSIRHHCEELVRKGVLYMGKFNKLKIDKTLWYAFVDENFFLGEDDSNNSYERGKPQSTGENPNPFGENPKAIPDPKSSDPRITDNSKREEAAPPTPAVYKSYKKVKIKAEKYNELIGEFGEVEVKEMMERLDDYGDRKPKKFKEYNPHCHGAVIKKWLKDEQKKDRDDEVKIDEQAHRKMADEVVHNFHKEVEKNHIQLQNTGLLFCYGRVYELIEFRDIEFPDKLACRLTQMALK